MTVKIHYRESTDPRLIRERKVAVIGYGSQGHAHALNLADSGVEVVVGLRTASSSAGAARESGLDVRTPAEAAEWADLVMMLVPDQHMSDVYREDVAPHLESGDALFFAHGFNVHFGEIEAPDGVDVAMVAPKGPGHLVRRTYEEGSGVPALVAVDKDASGTAMDLAVSYADAIGATRAGVPTPSVPPEPGFWKRHSARRRRPISLGSR